MLFCEPKNRSYGFIMLPQIYSYKFPFGIMSFMPLSNLVHEKFGDVSEPKNSLNGLLILPERFPLDN